MGTVRRAFQFFLVSQGVGPGVLVRAKSRADAKSIAQANGYLPGPTSVALPRTVRNWRAGGAKVLGEAPITMRRQGALDDFDAKLAAVEAGNDRYRGHALLRMHEGDYLVLDPRGFRVGQAPDLAAARRLVDAALGD